MIVVFYGSDTFSSRQALRKAINKFQKERDPLLYNVRRFVAGECQWKDVASEALASPFLAEKRMVVVEGVCGSGDDQLIAWVREMIEKTALPESTTLVLWEGGGKTKGTGSKLLLDILKKQQFAVECEMPKDNMMSGYVLKKSKEVGVSFSPKGLLDFTMRFGGDSWAIGSALEMLSVYKKNTEVDEKHIEQLFGFIPVDNVFACVEAICENKKSFAQEILLGQERVGADPQMLLPLFAKQLRMAWYMAEQPPSSQQVVVQVLKAHPFAVEKAYALARKVGMARLQIVHLALCRAYEDARSGVDPWLALQRFVAV